MAHVVTAPDWADVLARGSFCQYIYLTAWLSCIDIERFRMIQISWKWWDCIAHTAEILQNHGLFTLDGACWFLECVSFKCVWKPLQWPESFRSFVEIVLAYLERLMKPAMCQQTLGPKPFEPWTHLEMSEIPQRVSRISILFRSLGCQAFARSSELPAWFERTVDRRDTVTLDAIVTIWCGSLSHTITFPDMQTFQCMPSPRTILKGGFREFTKKIVVIVRVRQLQQPMRIMRSEFLRDQAKGTQYWNSFFIEHESYSRLLITEKIVLFCPGEMISGASNCKICKCHRVSHWKGVNSHTIYRYL